MRLPSILDDLSVGVARGLGDRQRCAALRQFQSERYIFDGLDAVEPTGVVGVEEDVDAAGPERAWDWSIVSTIRLAAPART